MKDNRIHAFTYKNPLAGFIPWGYGGLPKDLGNMFIRRMLLFQTTLPDTNTYFIPFRISATKKLELKHTIDSLKIWTVTDKDAAICNELNSDATENKLWLITKKDINLLYFYDLEQTEESCPGSIHRQRAIQLIKAFNAVFH